MPVRVHLLHVDLMFTKSIKSGVSTLVLLIDGVDLGKRYLFTKITMTQISSQELTFCHNKA